MFSLLHVHFESVLRAIAETRPDLLKKVYRSFNSAQYRAASPAQRLRGMCPVSNTRLGVFDWNQPFNPAKKAMQLGIPVTINTDDPILFQTTLAQEIALAHLNAEEIKMIQATGRKYGYRHE